MTSKFLLFFCFFACIHDSQASERRLPSTKKEITISYAPLVKKASPAVVNIYTKRVVKTRNSPFSGDPFFSQFFGDNFFNFGAPRERIQNSLGSGVVVRSNGIIVTNQHVIEGAEEITVVLPDKRELPARIVLADKRTDLAVLKVNSGSEILTSLQLVDSDDLAVGDLVLAIGNPFGVGQTVTSGIVSALSRAAEGVSDFSFFIQTDAAINPGNSGGALVTMDGKLAGINTAIYSRSGGSQGIGFAIPANMVARIIDSALGGKGLLSPWLGAAGQKITVDLASNMGLKRPVGVLINKVYPGGPADRAGLKVGDIVVSVNKKEVETPAALRFRIATLRLGGVAVLEIWRAGKLLSLNFPVETAPENPKRSITRLEGKHPLVGAVIANMSPALAEELSLDPLSTGVIVLKIRKRSPAKVLGLEPGDYLIGINGKLIDKVSTAKNLLNSGSARWDLTIRRGDDNLSVTVQ
ncbi:MAG: Do family serine endopeptidase [Rhodospirillaceae bacterium]